MNIHLKKKFFRDSEIILLLLEATSEHRKKQPHNYNRQSQYQNSCLSRCPQSGQHILSIHLLRSKVIHLYTITKQTQISKTLKMAKMFLLKYSCSRTKNLRSKIYTSSIKYSLYLGTLQLSLLPLFLCLPDNSYLTFISFWCFYSLSLQFN